MAKEPKGGLGDVARAAGVSKMTVSRVLRGGTGFSDATRARVLREVDRQGYVPNRLAAAFASDRASTLVGICVPRLTSRLFAEVLEAAGRTLARLGYQTMIGSHDQLPAEEEAWLRELAAWKPAGIILSGRTHTPATAAILRGLAGPVVEVWDLNTQPLDLSVGFSHEDCGAEMGRFVAAAGRRRVGSVGALGASATMGHARRRGFARALGEAGVPLVDAEVLHDRPGFYAGWWGAEVLLARRPDLDALYFHDDEMAIGGMAFCVASGRRVPDDIGIAGWGGLEAASILPRRLTTTAVPAIAIGRTAAEALVARLRGEPVADVTVLPARLVPGATV